MIISRRVLLAGFATFATLGASANVAFADSILDRVNSNQSIRIGFSNEVPWAYPGENNKPLGFANALALGVLKSMGYENIEPVITEWGSLIPGLNANRFDIITAGMYILKARCENVSFADPLGIFGDVFIVPKGNPKNIQTYQDLKDKGAVVVTAAGYSIVEVAKKEGISASNIMQVPGTAEILEAVKGGRADAGGVTLFTGRHLVEESGGAVELTDPAKMPDYTFNWVSIGFRKGDTEFLKAYNEAQARYLGTDEMLKAVAEYGYTKDQLPGDTTAEFACANR